MKLNKWIKEPAGRQNFKSSHNAIFSFVCYGDQLVLTEKITDDVIGAQGSLAAQLNEEKVQINHTGAKVV